jgi:hypothetical protein
MRGVRLAGCHGWSQAEAERNSEAPAGVRRKADFGKARGRSWGKSPDKVLAGRP